MSEVSLQIKDLHSIRAVGKHHSEGPGNPRLSHNPGDWSRAKAPKRNNQREKQSGSGVGGETIQPKGQFGLKLYPTSLF